MSHLVLITPSDVTKIVVDDPANAGYDDAEIRSLLQGAATRGHSFEVVDSDELSDDDRERRYFEAGVRAAALRIRLSSHFGSGRESGVSHFGRQVPALLVYDREGGTLVDVYPHSRAGGLLITIADFLTDAGSRPHNSRG